MNSLKRFKQRLRRLVVARRYHGHGSGVPESTPARFRIFSGPGSGPGVSETSDLCEISDLLMFVSYFPSQSNEPKFGH